MAEEDEFPAELTKRLVSLDESLTNYEEVIKNFHKVTLAELQEQLTPLEKVKLDLVGAYAINSLFWVYLNVRGINPKEHAIKQELDRIRAYMGRVKEITDKQSAPKLDVDASKRFLRNALWDAAHKKTPVKEEPATKKRKSDESESWSSTKASQSCEGMVKKKHKKKKKQDS